MTRIIFHVDQNCYFASVEMIAHPECRNVPMAVAGDKEKRHGIILAKNQLASKAGVKTAEAIWQAMNKCPDLVLLEPHYEKYQFYSERLREMYQEYTDKVEPFGLDECWLDLTDTIGDRDPVDVADEIRRRVREEFGLTCSIGVSFNKVFAKLGSDYKKPDATTVISEDNFKDIVWPLPCSDLLFVGRQTTARLNKVNIRTIGDLANCDQQFLLKYLGKNGYQLWISANGKDDSEVHDAGFKREIKSVSNSTTTTKDMASVTEISATFHALSSKVAGRLRKYGLKGNVVAITVRDKNLVIYDKQRVLGKYIDNSNDIYKTAMLLFNESYDWHASVRSIGVRVTNLVEKAAPEQISIFDELNRNEKSDKLERTLDAIKERYGKDSVITCAELGQREFIPEAPKGTFMRDASDSEIGRD